MMRLTTRDLPADPEQPKASAVLLGDPQVTADLDEILAYMDESRRRTAARIAAVQAWIDWLNTPAGLWWLGAFCLVVGSLALYVKWSYGG